jgi:hypothetical protein
MCAGNWDEEDWPSRRQPVGLIIMSELKIADRIAARNQARIDALRLAISRDGIQPAIDYAQSVLEGEGSTNLSYRKLVAMQIVELNPSDPAIWNDRELNTILRSICAEAIVSGEALSEHLRAFASQALMKAMPPRRRGQPSDLWQRHLVLAVLRDLKLANIPAYYGESSNGQAKFTGVQIVRKIIPLEERTLREWWQSRPKTDLGDM